MPAASARNCRAAPAIRRPPTNRPTASTRVRLKAVPASATNTGEPESCQALQPTRARSTPSHGGIACRGMSAKPMGALPSRPTWSGMGPTAAQPASRTPWFRKPAMGTPSKPKPGGACQVRQPSRPWQAQCQRLLPIKSQWAASGATSLGTSGATPKCLRPTPRADGCRTPASSPQTGWPGR